MKNLKFENLDLDKFKENEIDHSKVGKIIGGNVYCHWSTGNTTCDTVNWGSSSTGNSNGTFSSVQTAQDINIAYEGCS